MKGSVHLEDTAVINLYACNSRAPKYMKQKLTELKGKTDNSPLLVNGRTPLGIMI